MTHARAAYEPGFSGYGGHVVIKHGLSGPWTLYAHLDTVAVAPGQFVREGQKLGTVGNTRFTTDDPTAVFSGGGYHVHFEVSPRAYPLPADATRLDPRPFLGLSPTPLVGAKAAGGGFVTLLVLGGGAWWLWKRRGRA